MVRCLECGNAYAKPCAGGTVDQNPGCPRCGYIGWIDLPGELMPPTAPTRYDAGPPPHRRDRRR
jgi:hypothetical protein